MISQRAVKVVLDMFPKPGLGAAEYDSGAYWDLLTEHADANYTVNVQLDVEVKEVLKELGRGNFSVLELTEDK